MRLISKFRTLFTRLTSLQELLVYVAIWLLVYLFPVVNEALGITQEADFSWRDIMISWARITPFLVIFIIHNYLLVYQLLIGHKLKRYIISAVVLLITFCSFQYAGPERT